MLSHTKNSEIVHFLRLLRRTYLENIRTQTYRLFIALNNWDVGFRSNVWKTRTSVWSHCETQRTDVEKRGTAEF